MKCSARKLTSFFCLLIFCFSISYCAELSVSASVDKNTLSLDDQLVLEVNVSGNVSNVPNPVISDLPNFTVYSSGRSQSISIINGQMSSSVAFHYTLVPKSTGKFTIPSITLTYGSKTYSTSPIAVEVTQAASPAAGGTAASPQPSAVNPQGNIKNLFVTASINKNTAYVNEQIVFTFRFFRRVQLLSNPQYNAPNFTSFWTEDTPPKNYSASIGGARYMVSEVKTLLFPTRPGKFEIPPATLTCNIEDFDRSNPFADDFFSGFFSTGKTQTLRTNGLSIDVKPLPEDKPADFGGAAGSFTISSSLDKKTAKVGDPMTLVITVSGTGNIKGLTEPNLSLIPGFRKYETVSSINVDTSQGEARGSKVFKTVIVPETPGKKIIGAISFSFFNPSQHKYVTEKSNPIPVEVVPAEPGTMSQYTGMQQSQGEIKVINADIEYLKGLKKWKNYSGLIYKNLFFLLFNLIPVLALLGAFFYIKWAEKIATDVSFARRLRAFKTARKYLRKAKSLMSPEKSHEYYNAVSRALLEYIAHKLNVSAEGLTLGLLEEKLLARKVSPETIDKTKKALEECDMVRFSPASVSENMTRSNFKSVENLIEKLERELK